MIYRLVPELVKQMGAAYPELVRAEALITETLKLEESRFKQMLDRGLKLLDEETGKLKKDQATNHCRAKWRSSCTIPTDFRWISRRMSCAVAARRSIPLVSRPLWPSRKPTHARLGQDRAKSVRPSCGLNCATSWAPQIFSATQYRKGRRADHRRWWKKANACGKEAKAGNDDIQIIVNQTPFYAESGGQMGDTGLFTTASGAVVKITDTQKEAETVWVHHGYVEKGVVKTGDMAVMDVDGVRRANIRAHHSATHLLHEALRRKLGPQVTQKGSLVAPDRLRFDFSQPTPITAEDAGRDRGGSQPAASA